MQGSKLQFLATRQRPEGCTWQILGLPFDAASSYRKGACFGPSEIRLASGSIESYSPYLSCDLEELNIFDADDLDISSRDPDEAIEAIKNYYAEHYKQGHRILCLGGDHSVTIGALKGIVEAGVHVNLLFLDAHYDLREEYNGAPISHCCVARCAAEILGTDALVQWGMRSSLRSEFEWAKRHKTYLGRDLDSLQRSCHTLKGKPVYLSLDLDVFDPSEMPAVGNPEPGGLKFPEFLSLLDYLQPLDIMGVDVVELSPVWDPSGRSAVMAAEIIRELLLTVVR